MKNNEERRVLGLDIGTSRIVAASRKDGEERFESQLNAFVTIPWSKITEDSMKREGVPHAVANSEITIFGNESAKIADLLGSEVRRPMTRGLLNAGEPARLDHLNEIIRSTLPAGNEWKSARLCFSVPAPPGGQQEMLTHHEATVRQTLAQLGFNDVRTVNEGVAVIYSELEDSNYTGIGVSFGGGLCNVALAYLSVPVLCFSLPKGGDFIDTSAAAVTGEMANRIRIVKEESFHCNGRFADKVLQALGVYYDDVIQSIVQGVKAALDGSGNVPKFRREVPIVLSGGGVLPEGFQARFEESIRAAALPLEISEVRLARSPLETTARGALISALSE